MGLFDTFSSIVSGVKSAASIASTAMGLYGSYKASKQQKDIMSQGQAEAGRIAQNQAQLQALSRRSLHTAEGMTDRAAHAQTGEIYRALLSGQKPSQLPQFRSQFQEIEQATQAKLRDIDKMALAERQKMVSSVPQGGMRLRMLADLAMKTKDQKAAIISEARDVVQRKNVELKDKYTTQALEYGRGQPQQALQGYQVSGQMLQQTPTAGPTGGQQLTAATSNLESAQGALGKIGESIGALATKPKPQEPVVRYVPAAPKPTYEQYVPSPAERGMDDRYK